MHDELILAVDGGATNCRAVLCTTKGQVLSIARSGSCNYQNIGLESAVENLREVLSQAMAGHRAPYELRAAVFGLAGIDTGEDYRIVAAAVQGLLEQLGIESQNTIVENDAMISLLGAVGQGDGVLVIAGTGAIACGITRQGKRTRAGGWGNLLDDAGSGYAVGKAALTHVMCAYDGREPESKLAAAVLEQLALKTPEQIVNWTYSPNYSVEQVAALAAVVCRLAEQGDWKAKSILNEAVQHLHQLAATVIKRLNLETLPFPLLLNGGLLQHAPGLREQLSAAIQRDFPLAAISDAEYPPICGAIMQALFTVDIDHCQVMNRLNRQLDIS